MPRKPPPLTPTVEELEDLYIQLEEVVSRFNANANAINVRHIDHIGEEVMDHLESALDLIDKQLDYVKTVPRRTGRLERATQSSIKEK